MISGTRFTAPLVNAYAVAYAEKAFPKSRIVAPRMEGSNTGKPTCSQYWNELAPRLDAASRHSLRKPSIAGAITRIISGIWKYMYVITTPQNEKSVKPWS